MTAVRWRSCAAAIAILSCSCRGCESKGDREGVSAEAPASASASLDARSSFAAGGGAEIEAHRAAAQVPALAWARVTRETLDSGALGLADIEANTAATSDTPFEVASIAKLVIAIAVMQLVEERQLALDADVSAYLPFPVRHPRFPAAPITLRHLLSHTSAIVDLPELTSADDRTELEAFLRGYFDGDAGAFVVDAGPGSTMRYSNVGPSLAALAVEHVAKVKFRRYVQKHIFDPLEMGTATYERVDAVAAPYSRRAKGFMRLGPPSHALYPVVDLFVSVRDLGKLAQAILRGGVYEGTRVLSEPSVEEMLRPPPRDAGSGSPPTETLGWQLRSFGAVSVVGHEGEDAGASTALYLDRARGIGVVLLTNGDAFQGRDEGRAKALSDLIEKLLRSRDGD